MRYWGAFAGKKVLVTGHTGFKGAWLSIYLQQLGAQVIGYSLPAPTDPSLFAMAGLDSRVETVTADIRDTARLTGVIKGHQPDFIFHMAAQSLVLESYQQPKETFDVNVMGSVSLLEAIRISQLPTTVITVVTDKCYENREWVYGYRETDPLGGVDPYSASKAAMDIAVSAYRSSFFQPDKVDQHGIRVASVRSGNVIGGGDWADRRIVPDAIRALSQGQTLEVRRPNAVRPWQHVLEPLSGYLWLAARLADDPTVFASAWNFGPELTSSRTVRELVELIIETWQGGTWLDKSDPDAPHEATLLQLSIEKAYALLGWQPVWDFDTTIRRTVDWYRRALISGDPASVYALCFDDIDAYEARAREKRLAWTR